MKKFTLIYIIAFSIYICETNAVLTNIDLEDFESKIENIDEEDIDQIEGFFSSFLNQSPVESPLSYEQLVEIKFLFEKAENELMPNNKDAIEILASIKNYLESEKKENDFLSFYSEKLYNLCMYLNEKGNDFDEERRSKIIQNILQHSNKNDSMAIVLSNSEYIQNSMFLYQQLIGYFTELSMKHDLKLVQNKLGNLYVGKVQEKVKFIDKQSRKWIDNLNKYQEKFFEWVIRARKEIDQELDEDIKQHKIQDFQKDGAIKKIERTEIEIKEKIKDDEDLKNFENEIEEKYNQDRMVLLNNELMYFVERYKLDLEEIIKIFKRVCIDCRSNLD